MDDFQFMSMVTKNRVESKVALPTQVDAEARRASASVGTTFDDFVAEAIVEKLAVLEQGTYFATRFARAKSGRGLELLRRAGTAGIAGAGDEIK